MYTYTYRISFNPCLSLDSGVVSKSQLPRIMAQRTRECRYFFITTSVLSISLSLSFTCPFQADPCSSSFRRDRDPELTMAVTAALTAHAALPVQEHPIFTGGPGVWRILCIVQMRQGGAEQTAGAMLTGVRVGTGPT